MSVILFIIILLVLVVVHEAGHFFIAKWSNIRVDEFAFGFPPKIVGVKKGETEYVLNALPLGGYVKIYGEDGHDEHVSKDPRSFVSKKAWIKAAVLLGGIFANIVLAWILFSFSLMSGAPISVGPKVSSHYIENPALTITDVLPNSPAEKSGIKMGDVVKEVSSNQTRFSATSPDSMRAFIINHADEKIAITLSRAGKERVVTVIPEKKDNTARIGVGLDIVGTAHLPIQKAFVAGLGVTVNFFTETIKAFALLVGQSITGQGSVNSLTGPVGMAHATGEAASFGFAYVLSFAALISINLAVLNLLPFPALDGGRLLFLIIEKIRGKELPRKFTMWANGIGFGILLLLMIGITVHDILKLW